MVVSATREIAASTGRIFGLIADPAQQPRWDGNDNLAAAARGQRVRSVGEVFIMTLTGAPSARTMWSSSRRDGGSLGNRRSRVTIHQDTSGRGHSSRSAPPGRG